MRDPNTPLSKYGRRITVILGSEREAKLARLNPEDIGIPLVNACIAYVEHRTSQDTLPEEIANSRDAYALRHSIPSTEREPLPQRPRVEGEKREFKLPRDVSTLMEGIMLVDTDNTNVSLTKADILHDAIDWYTSALDQEPPLGPVA